MPVARSASIHSTATSLPVVANNVVESTDAGDGDGDGDDRTYCFCDGVSYGEMIACDDAQCEREWVRLSAFIYPFLISPSQITVPFGMHWTHRTTRGTLVLRCLQEQKSQQKTCEGREATGRRRQSRQRLRKTCR